MFVPFKSALALADNLGAWLDLSMEFFDQTMRLGCTVLSHRRAANDLALTLAQQSCGID